MENKKHLLALLALLLILALSASGCTLSGGRQTDQKTKIVVTVFPLYDWTRQLCKGLEDTVEITYLVSNGADLHSYQPTVRDIARIADADLVLLVGGTSDGWLESALTKNKARNPQRTVLRLAEAEGVTLYQEEQKEGMTAEEEEEEETFDEHLWLSLRNAEACVEAIAGELAGLLGENGAAVLDNAERYCEKLDGLLEAHRQDAESCAGKTLIFADRFPFLYLTKELGLDYYAPFPGCSAESEASFETIAFLTKKVTELQPAALFVLPGSSLKIAETIEKNAGLPTLRTVMLDPMQQTSSAEADNGTDYLSVMEHNLDAVFGVLNG